MVQKSGTIDARRLGKRERREAMHAYVFMSPVIIGLLVFTLGPIIVSLFLSFSNYNLLNDPKWIGVDNYVKMYGERLFWQSLRVSAIYSIVSVPLGMTIALFLALLLNRTMRGIYTLRAIYYLPTVISGVGVAMLWRWIFNGQYGVINTLLRNVGVKGPNWLLDENYALIALIITSVWDDVDFFGRFAGHPRRNQRSRRNRRCWQVGPVSLYHVTDDFTCDVLQLGIGYYRGVAGLYGRLCDYQRWPQ